MSKTIKHDEQNNALFGDEDHLEVSQNKSFSQMIFELLSEQEPTPDQLKVFELILNLSIDHGTDTPSAKVVIEEAQNGETISEAVAEGIEQINDVHGGAIEPCMEVFYKVQSQKSKVKSLVEEYIQGDKKMSGFGHRIYKDTDPRAQLILKVLSEKLKVQSEKWMEIALDIEKELEVQKGKKLPINIDGAIAVALCSFGWESRLGKAVFIIARTPGLCGQYLNAT